MSASIPQGSKIARSAAVALALWLGGFAAHAAYVNSYYRKPIMEDLLELEIRRNDPVAEHAARHKLAGADCRMRDGLWFVPIPNKCQADDH